MRSDSDGRKEDRTEEMIRFLVRLTVFAGCIGLASVSLRAQTFIWQPSPGHTQLPIWPGAAPDPQPVKGPEIITTRTNDHLVAGRPWTYISNVSRPTMTVYPATGKNTGATVVVFPGGGYQILAIDLEGTEACNWLVSKGITCVLLKYRVTDIGDYPKSGPVSGIAYGLGRCAEDVGAGAASCPRVAH